MTSENEYTDAAGVRYVAKPECGTFFDPCHKCAHDSGSIRIMKRGCKSYGTNAGITTIGNHCKQPRKKSGWN